MARWRFVHAADLHLDSPFVGLAHYHPHIQEELVSATFASFRRLVDLCLSSRAEFLLLAGDLFDGPRFSLKAQVRLRQELARLAEAGIETFIVWGNHDYLAGTGLSLDWPEGVTVFPPGEVTACEVRRDGATLARIFGVSHGDATERNNLGGKFHSLSSGPFTIGLLHANLDKSTEHEDYAPCSLADLTRPGYDYWALGHIHKPGVRRAAQPAVVYAGNPQGRHLKESGPRGCYLVEVDGHEVQPRFQETGVISWAAQEVDISEVSRLTQVAAHLAEVVESVRPEGSVQGLILRLTLKGRGPVHRELRLPGNVEDLLEEVRQQGQSQRPWVWVDGLALATAPDWDLEALKHGSDLAAMVMEMLEACSQSGEISPEIITLLESLYLHPQGRRHLPPWEALDRQALITEATEELLTRLFPGGEA